MNGIEERREPELTCLDCVQYIVNMTKNFLGKSFHTTCYKNGATTVKAEEYIQSRSSILYTDMLSRELRCAINRCVRRGRFELPTLRIGNESATTAPTPHRVERANL